MKKGYAVNAETMYSIPVVYERGMVKLFRKKNGIINYNRGNPDQEIKAKVSSEISSKGVYCFDFTEKRIDDKNLDVVTLYKYKKTTAFRTFMTVFWSIVGIGGLVTVAAIIPSNP
jgi:hypothetical protein